MPAPFSGQSLPAKFGNYTLQEFVAFGGTAEIFKASAHGGLGLEKTVTIKRILPQYCQDKLFIDMLVHEARLCAGLQHANIVQIFELGRVEGRTYIAMEYVPGYDLAEVRDLAWQREGELPQEIVYRVMSEALEGLDYAHRATDAAGNFLGIVHRDFNPTNILLSRQGGVKLTDFGVAKATQRSSNTVSSMVKGKFGYLSPEQVQALPLDARSDLFTAGITLWELLAGRPMFQGIGFLAMMTEIRDARFPDLRSVAPKVSESLAALVRRALQRHPDDRYQSAAEFKEALDAYFLGHGVHVGAVHLARYLSRITGHDESLEVPALALDETQPELDLNGRPTLPTQRAHAPAGGTPSVPPVAWEAIDQGEEMAGPEIGHEVDTQVVPRGQSPVAVRAQAMVDAARDLAAQGSLWEALDCLDGALQRDPAHAEADRLHARVKAQLIQLVFTKLDDPDLVPFPRAGQELRKRKDLDSRAGFLLSQMDGVTTLGDLVDISSLGQLQTMRILVELLDRGIIELRENE